MVIKIINPNDNKDYNPEIHCCKKWYKDYCLCSKPYKKKKYNNKQKSKIMSNFSVKGKLIEVFDVVEGVGKESGNAWMKRSFIVETDDKYDNLFCIEAFGSEAIAQIDNFNIGDEVDVFFNIKTNKWKDKYFVSLGLWKFVTEPKPTGDINTTQPEPSKDGGEQEDLPF